MEQKSCVLEVLRAGRGKWQFEMIVEDGGETWTAVGIWIRLLFSLAGMFIEIDRGLKRRGAGIKTHVLVCLGSAIVMLTSEYMFRTFPSAKADMARMAQVIGGTDFVASAIMATGPIRCVD